jgi:hypothetical protein
MLLRISIHQHRSIVKFSHKVLSSKTAFHKGSRVHRTASAIVRPNLRVRCYYTILQLSVMKFVRDQS